MIHPVVMLQCITQRVFCWQVMHVRYLHCELDSSVNCMSSVVPLISLSHDSAGHYVTIHKDLFAGNAGSCNELNRMWCD